MKMRDLIYNIDTFNGMFGMRFNKKDIYHIEKNGDVFIYFDKDMRVIGFDIKDGDKYAFDLLSKYAKYKINKLVDNKK